MSNRYVDPVQQAIDQNGDAIPGSKLNFFASGTTTPKTVYSDAQLNVALTQPVVADAAGRFPSIFLDGTNHRVQFLDDNDVQIDVYDPVSGTNLNNTPILFSRIVEKFTATQGQTIFNLANSYTPGQNELQVYINGAYQNTPENYTESSSTQITFTSGLDAGDFVNISNLKNLNTPIQIEKQSATQGQTVFNLVSISYEVGSNKLLVWINGVLQATPENYDETGPQQVTFNTGLDAADFVTFYSF